MSTSRKASPSTSSNNSSEDHSSHSIDTPPSSPPSPQKTKCQSSDPNEEVIKHWEYLVTAKSAPPIRFTYVGTKELTARMIDHLVDAKNLAIYMDLEGQNLGRDGEICTLQLCIDTDQGPHAYLIDIWVLRGSAFSTKGQKYPDVTLKSLLENHAIPKLLWDCRMDSDALYAQFRVALEAVIDLQLMEVAGRENQESMRHLRGYGRCVEQDLDLDPSICKEIKETKNFQATFIPDKGGDWAVLKERPMCHQLKKYCIGDIRYMPPLFKTYGRILTDKEIGTSVIHVPSDLINNPKGMWARAVIRESRNRILQSWGKGWDRTNRREMSISPWAIPVCSKPTLSESGRSLHSSTSIILRLLI